MIEIGDMIIRVPSMSEAEANQLGEKIAERLSADNSAIRDSGNKQIGELSIRLSIETGVDHSALADSISKQLLMQLNSI